MKRSISLFLVIAMMPVTSAFLVSRDTYSRTKSATASFVDKKSTAMHRTNKNYKLSNTLLKSSNEESEKSEISMKDKIVYRRYVYYVSPESDISHSYSIEERTAYKFNDENELTPLDNKRTFIVRNPPPMDDGVLPPSDDQKRKDAKGFVRLGDKVCEIDVTLDDDEATTTNAEIAMIMYLISKNDKALHGDIAQIETEVGTGLVSTLSALAAGQLLLDKQQQIVNKDDDAPKEENDEKKEKSDDDILPHPDTPAPLPEKLSKISLFTNPTNPNSFKTVLQTLKSSSIAPSKLSIQNLNPLKSSTSSSSLVNSQNLILAVDLVTQYPDIAPLSKFIAYALKPTPYDRSINDVVVDDGGIFYHLSPIHRDILVDFKKKLSLGYKMNVSNDYVKIMQFDLVPWIADVAAASDGEGNDDEEEETSGELGIQGYVQFHSQTSEEYTVLEVVHDENYTGENGEYFFPVELGYDENGGYGGTDIGGTVGKQVEKDVGYKGGPGDGRWLDF